MHFFFFSNTYFSLMALPWQRLDFGQNMASNEAYCACNEPGNLRDVTTLLYRSFMLFSCKLTLIWHYFFKFIPHYCIAILTIGKSSYFCLYANYPYFPNLLFPTFLIYCLDDF